MPEPACLDLIRPHTGRVTDVRPARGNSSATTVLIDGERGSFFIKAVPNRRGCRRESLLREAAINPYVAPAFSPVMRWQAEDENWIVLGFDQIDARPCAFEPGSADLPAVAGLLDRIAAVPLPDIARDWPETRWNAHATDAETALLRGDALLYTDIHPSNVLIGDDRTWAIDWAWPTRGAAFIAPALFAVQLIAAGHTPKSAQDRAADCTAWRTADPRAVDAFATVNARLWQDRACRWPEAWLRAMADATRQWAAHRGL
ncbi:protein kinase [Actinocorallia populi]|uniref:protein kinase n=1 Tax=Actinocorallia populi TaxID=2079200 RepID=UPI0018E4FBC6|nr:protein kinase [Actinocorallia populi]